MIGNFSTQKYNCENQKIWYDERDNDRREVRSVSVSDSSGKKSRGRPKGQPKKAYTVRLDSVLADVLDEYTKLVLNAYPTGSASEVYEAIFHQFFFATTTDSVKYSSKSRELSARPARDILSYLLTYLYDRELAEEERWFFMHDLPTDEDVQRLISDRDRVQEPQAAAKELRLRQLRQYRAAWTEEDQAKHDAEVRRIAAMLATTEQEEKK